MVAKDPYPIVDLNPAAAGLEDIAQELLAPTSRDASYEAPFAGRHDEDELILSRSHPSERTLASGSRRGLGGAGSLA